MPGRLAAPLSAPWLLRPVSSRQLPQAPGQRTSQRTSQKTSQGTDSAQAAVRQRARQGQAREPSAGDALVVHSRCVPGRRALVVRGGRCAAPRRTARLRRSAPGISSSFPARGPFHSQAIASLGCFRVADARGSQPGVVTTRRRNVLRPSCSTLPSSSAGEANSRLGSLSFSPSSRTPPFWIWRRASLLVTPRPTAPIR